MPSPEAGPLRPFARFAVRDALVLAATVALFRHDAALRASGGAGDLGVGIAAGTLFALTGFFVHEWGHLLGAVRSGGVVHAPRSLAAFFLFRFDTGRSTRAQFLAMSYGGYAGTVVALAALAVVGSTSTWSGRTALVLAGLGMSVAAALEIPTTVRVARGAPLPTGFAFVGPNESPN